MRKNPAVWFEIYVQDMNRAKKFYESVFQGKLEKLNNPGLDMWAFPMEMNASGDRERRRPRGSGRQR